MEEPRRRVVGAVEAFLRQEVGNDERGEEAERLRMGAGARGVG